MASQNRKKYLVRQDVIINMDMKKCIHLKTGNVYYRLFDTLDCTNIRAGADTVVYCNEDGMIFVRKKKEFEEKFKVVE